MRTMAAVLGLMTVAGPALAQGDERWWGPRPNGQPCVLTQWSAASAVLHIRGQTGRTPAWSEVRADGHMGAVIIMPTGGGVLLWRTREGCEAFSAGARMEAVGPVFGSPAGG